MGDETLTGVLIVLYILGFCAVYVLPTVVAFRRGHPNRFVIAAINLVGGMTGFLWVMTLIWAFQKHHVDESETTEQETYSAYPEVLIKNGRDKAAQLADLRRSLDAGDLTAEEFGHLKAEIMRA